MTSASASTDTSDRELTITRIFDAPRAVVFEVLSKAKHQRWSRLTG